MSLHDRIMAMIPCVNGHMLEKVGFKIARKHAAKLATEADELMAEMAEALSNVNKLIAEGAEHGFNYDAGDWAERLFFSQQRTSNAIKAYNTYKERNNER